MKIGTDSILLGCLCDVKNIDSALDIGCGTGILALMLAQRSFATIDAVEIDELAAKEAQHNFRNSPWSERLSVHNGPIQQFTAQTSKTYDLVISNPPYYPANHHFSVEDEQRSKARHDKELSFETLAQCVFKLLSSPGSFWLILPVQEASLFKQRASESGLYLRTQINLVPKPGKAVNRVVMQFSKQEGDVAEEDLVIYETDQTPSLRYKQLAQEFYTGKQFVIE